MDGSPESEGHVVAVHVAPLPPTAKKKAPRWEPFHEWLIRFRLLNRTLPAPIRNAQPQESDADNRQ